MPDEVNKTDFPIRFSFPWYVRFFLILIAGVTAIYSLFFLTNYVYSDTPIFFKLLPTMILYVSLDTVFRHLTSLNRVTFTQDSLVLQAIAKKKLVIPYVNINNLVLKKRITYYVQIHYLDLDGNQKVYQSNASFPKMLTILLTIYDMSPNLELDEKLKDALEYIRIREGMKEDKS